MVDHAPMRQTTTRITGGLKMTLQEINRFEFVRIDEYNRYIINAHRAHNSFTLNAVLSVLQSNGYKLAQYFPGVIVGIKQGGILG